MIQRNHHVALAIDCSGSMDGEKLENAKESAISVVRRLSPSDLVSIVTFESEVEVKLNPTSASDPNIENIIRSINVGGATALHGGISTAFQLLRQASAANMISRLDVFGIGDDYNGPLLMKLSECGGGKWEHVADTSDLTTIVNTQVTEMQNTVISNPQLKIALMNGAELAAAVIVKPTLQEINLQDIPTSAGTYSIGLKDIIKDQSQTIAMRVAVPPIEGENILFVDVGITEGNSEVAHATAKLSCSNDKELYNMEIDPNPRILLSGSEATVLLRQGIDGDEAATKLAKTIIKNLDDPETTKLMDDDAHATVINAKEISGDIKPGMSEAEKKRVLHSTTVIETKESNLTCPNCNSLIRPTAKFCVKCGKAINKNEVEE